MVPQESPDSFPCAVSGTNTNAIYRLVKVLFSMARENAPSVIFIDEIDALCGQRGDGESEAARRIKTEMLVQMDGVGHDNKGILVLGTTNLPWQLDSAMRRRFQKRVHIGLPDPNARATMFKLAIGKAKTTLQEKDFRTLAAKSEGFSGSDISTTVQTALMRPLQKVMGATHFKPVCSPNERSCRNCILTRNVIGYERWEANAHTLLPGRS